MILFIDMDNTIAENTTPFDISYYPGLYTSKRPIQIVIDAILTLYPNTTYIIITNTQGNIQGRIEKMNWLQKYFPHASDIVFLDPNQSKSEYIQNYLNYHKPILKDVTIIDDKKHIPEGLF